ncbi:MAG: 2-keto-3-deoxygluconate permease [Treponema sp.]|nr:2-keto-3-deoxygluconate permease [Treponema sp.]
MDMIQKVPGGMMVCMMLLGCLINTFFPKALMIGSFTTYLFKNGHNPMIGMLLVCSGAQITVRNAGLTLYKGMVLNVSKVLLGIAIGLILGKVAGPQATLLGLTPLALIAAMSNSNGGLYTALATRYGEESDIGAIAVLSINDGPFFTMLAMGASGLANIPWITLIACLVPRLVGMLLGNLDDKWRKFLAPGVGLAVPFMGLPLGANLNIKDIFTAGIPGVVLGVMTVIITGFGSYFIYKFVVPRKNRKSSALGFAVGTAAGNSAATPLALAAIDPSLAPYAAAATVQVSAAVVISALLVPFMVDFLDKLEKKSQAAAAPA